MEEKASLVRWKEAMELLQASKDHLMLNQLLNHANYVVIGCFQTDDLDELPVCDFDLNFYLETIKRFCKKPDFLRAVLKEENVNEKFHSSLVKVKASKKLVFDATGAGDERFYNALGYIRNQSPSHVRRLRNEVRVELMRRGKAIELLRLVDDPITETLMHFANYIAVIKLMSDLEHNRREAFFSVNPPGSCLDYYFFMLVTKEFCSHHDFLKRVLEGADLRWFSENEEVNHFSI